MFKLQYGADGNTDMLAYFWMYPFVFEGYPDVEVILRSPEFGDSIRVNTNTVNTETRRGEQVTIRDVTWPISQIYRYTFTRITDEKVDEFKDFLIDYAGQEMQTVDHLGIIRVGVILTPVNEMIRVRGICSNDISFDFRGEIPW